MTLAWSTTSLPSVQPASSAAEASRIGRTWRLNLHIFVHMMSVGRSELGFRNRPPMDSPRKAAGRLKPALALCNSRAFETPKAAESRGFMRLNCGEIGPVAGAGRDSGARALLDPGSLPTLSHPQGRVPRDGWPSGLRHRS